METKAATAIVVRIGFPFVRFAASPHSKLVTQRGEVASVANPSTFRRLTAEFVIFPPPLGGGSPETLGVSQATAGCAGRSTRLIARWPFRRPAGYGFGLNS
jgi:hypothetical protein